MKFNKEETDSEETMLPPSPRDADFVENDVESPELLLKMFMNAVLKLWTQLKLAASFVMVDLGVYELFDKLLQWCVRNPHTSICFVAAFLVFLLPFLIVLGVGLSALLMTLTGFLVLEGILLTIVAVLLIVCVGFLALALLIAKQLHRVV